MLVRWLPTPSCLPSLSEDGCPGMIAVDQLMQLLKRQNTILFWLEAVFFVAAIVTVIVMAVYVVRRLVAERGETLGGAGVVAEDEPENSVRVRVERPLKKAESALLRFLIDNARGRYIVATHVRLADFIKWDGHLETGLFKMCTNGHVDFLLLNPVSGDPFLAVEMDGSTHDTPAGSERDDRKKRLLDLAGVRLIRTRLGRQWSDDVLPAIQEALKPRT